MASAQDIAKSVVVIAMIGKNATTVATLATQPSRVFA